MVTITEGHTHRHTHHPAVVYSARLWFGVSGYILRRCGAFVVSLLRLPGLSVLHHILLGAKVSAQRAGKRGDGNNPNTKGHTHTTKTVLVVYYCRDRFSPTTISLVCAQWNFFWTVSNVPSIAFLAGETNPNGAAYVSLWFCSCVYGYSRGEMVFVL